MAASASIRHVVVDLETTGMSPARGDRIVEIGAVAIEHGRIAGTYQSLVDPDRLIPYGAQRIHGITDSMVIGQPSFAEVLPQLIEFCGDAVLVSHNAPFDRGFLDAEALAATGLPLPHRHLDTVRLARRWVPGLGRYSLDHLVAHFGLHIPPAQRHRALGDARATAELFLLLEALAREAGAALDPASGSLTGRAGAV